MAAERQVKTPAQIQVDYLLRLKKRGARGRAGDPTARKQKNKRPRKEGWHEPRIRVDLGLWSQVVIRQKTGNEFAGEKEMWDWALELVLALPIGSHLLAPEKKRTLFSDMKNLVKKLTVGHNESGLLLPERQE